VIVGGSFPTSTVHLFSRAAPAAAYDRRVSAEPGQTGRVMHDAESKGWVEQLRSGHPRHEQAVAKLHGVLVRVAIHELSRRRWQLGSIAGPEFDDLAQQAADDALMNILRKLEEFRGLSRFTTWGYKFVIFEVSSKVARHAWRRQPPSSEELDWHELPDWLAPRPGDQLEQREQLGSPSSESTTAPPAAICTPGSPSATSSTSLRLVAPSFSTETTRRYC
jgi:DNA-directed RNA polymerase specialized sigma24 family protein